MTSFKIRVTPRDLCSVPQRLSRSALTTHARDACGGPEISYYHIISYKLRTFRLLPLCWCDFKLNGLSELHPTLAHYIGLPQISNTSQISNESHGPLCEADTGTKNFLGARLVLIRPVLIRPTCGADPRINLLAVVASWFCSS
jgi:hypothetical protein